MPSQSLQQTYRDTVASVLAKLDDNATRRGANSWEFAIRNARVTRATARICGNWLTLEAAARSMSIMTPEMVRRWLVANRVFTGGARIALRNDFTPGICADVLLEEDVDIAARIREAYAGIREGIHAVANEEELDTANITQEADRRAAHDTSDSAPPWLESCEMAGWTASKSSEGRWLVTLDVPTAFYQATVSEGADGITRVRSELIANERQAEPGFGAVAVFLARTNYMLRFVRASFAGTSAWIETCFDTSPCAAEMREAFAALSATCALTHREAQYLQCDAIADAYLRPMPRTTAAEAAFATA